MIPFLTSATPEHVQVFARQQFFAAAQQIDPQLFLSLFPTSEEIQILDLSDSFPMGAWSEVGERSLDAWLRLRDTTLSAHIRAWQDRYRLADDWCAECALVTMLNQWPGPRSDRVNWVIPEIRGNSLTEYNVTPREPLKWCPELQPWEEVEARFLQQIRDQRDAVMRHVSAIRPDHTTPLSQRNPWHLKWLADYLIGQNSYYKLALQYWPDKLSGLEHSAQHRNLESTVRKGAKSAAELIGLSLPRAETN
ncbi:hypothetical protein BH24CHL4_BH24CHL4_19570 [soil metagenome]